MTTARLVECVLGSRKESPAQLSATKHGCYRNGHVPRPHYGTYVCMYVCMYVYVIDIVGWIDG